MPKFIPWTPDKPEPQPDEIVMVEAMDFSWRLPWKQVREDALSGFAVVFLEEEVTNAN